MADASIYVTSFEEIAWGIVLITLTIVMHGIGTTFALIATEGKDHPGQQSPLLAELFRVNSLAALLVLLHLSEVLVWAFFFNWKDCFPTLSQNYYVALMDYTTLGSNYDLPQAWRLLEGMIAICGLLTFAWTTSVLLSVVSEIQEGRLKRRRLRKRGPSGRTGED
jgi:voltage-gated potassium channel